MPLVFAVIAFGLAVVGGTPAAIIAVLVGLVALGIALLRSAIRTDRGEASRLNRLLGFGVVLFGLVGTLGIPGLSLGPSSPLLDRLPGVIWVVVGLVALAADRSGREARKSLVLFALAVTAVIGVIHIETVRDIGLDVMVLHKQAADAIAEGQNPYTEAVTVQNGAPDAAPDDVIVGYPYPPLTALVFSIGEWVFDDARFMGLIAWLAFLAMLGLSGLRERKDGRVFLVLLLAALPGWPLVLRAGWTEPLSLALLAAMFFTWSRQRVSGGLLGLGLASKQYFAVAAPILALIRGEKRWQRVSAAVVAVIVVLGVGFAWGPNAFWSAGIEFHLSTPPRPESSNLVGLASLLGASWKAPTAVTLGLGALVAIATGSGARSRTDVMLAVASTLAVSFFVSSQAFANYWYLIMGLVALALVDYLDRGPQGLEKV